MQDTLHKSREMSNEAASKREGPSAEQMAMDGLVVDTLACLQAFPDQFFREKCLRYLFPLLTSLIRCPAVTVEMQVALSDLFAAKLGPFMSSHR
jgi:hypothetical protein